MKRQQGILVASLLMLMGVALFIVYLLSPVIIWMDGQIIPVRSPALAVSDIIRTSGIPIHVGDIISPEPSSLKLNAAPIVIQRASGYAVVMNDQIIQTYSIQPIPANVLGQLGVRIFPNDQLYLDGMPIRFDQPAGYRNIHTLQFKRAWPVRIAAGTNPDRAASVTSLDPIAIRWQFGLRDNTLQLGIQVPSDEQNSILVKLSPSISNIGELSAWTGNSPQGLDQLSQNENAPADTSTFQVDRVIELFELNPKSLPYQNQTELDPTIELDQQKVTQAGQFGVSLQLSRVRYQNGQEVARIVENETVLQPPQDQITGYGTKVNVRTVDGGGKVLEYYRAVSLYATSYSPCRSGISTCSYGTASGEKMRKGIVAVVPRWFSYLSGQQVYIPGYGIGVIADTGGGIPGTNWIDLGFDDENYESWHSWVTVYFLTPIPENILYTLN